VLVEKLAGLLDRKVEKKSKAAVLVPLFDENCPKLVMIKRSKGLNRSAGHIAFPGGMIEDGENEVEAALREFEEEMGLNPDCVDILGFLRPREVLEYRIRICPVVGMIRTLDFVPDKREVSRVLVDELRKVLKSRRVTDWGPNFECAGHLVWGASSRVLDDLYLRIVRKYGSVDAFFKGF
jgi:8-oxo-dGTP pyrophosphatase MutT (NUDIX family)